MMAKEQAVFGIDKLNVTRSKIPTVAHVDYSARVQKVHAGANPRYHARIQRFKQTTGCPVIVNTSFNVRGEPIVCTPEETVRCFLGSEVEALAVGNCFLLKEDPDATLKQRCEARVEHELNSSRGTGGRPCFRTGYSRDDRFSAK